LKALVDAADTGNRNETISQFVHDFPYAHFFVLLAIAISQTLGKRRGTVMLKVNCLVCEAIIVH
jgi:hypothetical protein